MTRFAVVRPPIASRTARSAARAATGPVAALCVFLTASLALSCGSLQADSRVSGDLELKADVGSVVSTAIGKATLSRVDIATVRDSLVRGSLSVSVSTGDVASAAIGAGVADRVTVGSVVGSVVGGGRIEVSTGDISSVTFGTARLGGVRVGTVRHAVTPTVEVKVHTGRIVNVTGPAGGEVSIGNIGF